MENHDDILDIMLEHKLSKDEAIAYLKNKHVSKILKKDTLDLDNLSESEIVTMVNFVFTYETHFPHIQETIDRYEALYKITILEYLADYCRDHFSQCDDMEEAFLVEYNASNLVTYIDSRTKMQNENNKD